MKLAERLKLTASTIRNWPVIALDRAGLVARPRYKLHSGLVFECRSRTSDLAEVVVVCSGHEYPADMVRDLPAGAVVLDVGANIGAFCAFVDVHNRGTPYRGFAFEPFPDNAALLRSNLAGNRIDSYEVVEAAVSRVDGTVHLNVDCLPDEVSVATTPTATQVAAVRLSTFCRDRGLDRVDLLKLDVEGSEYDILDEDLPFVADHVETILVEFHPTADRDGEQWVVDRLSETFHVEVRRSDRGSGIVTGRRRRRTERDATVGP